MTPSALSLSLSTDCQRRLSAAALRQGATESALCQQWILEALERHEATLVTDSEGEGRCSVRTGIRTTGPTPLPLQQ